MIKYSLQCPDGHGFEAWFNSSETFGAQVESGDVPCPTCGATDVSKALMAPRVRSTKGVEAQPPAPSPSGSPQKQAMTKAAELKRQLLQLRRKVEANCDYVGRDFASKAREMAAGELEATGIYGEATPEETEALRDDGIEVGQIPWIREDA